MSSLKLYTSVISPVCRSVMLFLAANNIPYETVEVELGRGVASYAHTLAVAKP